MVPLQVNQNVTLVWPLSVHFWQKWLDCFWIYSRFQRDWFDFDSILIGFDNFLFCTCVRMQKTKIVTSFVHWQWWISWQCYNQP
jgi:hypothetical protein